MVWCGEAREERDSSKKNHDWRGGHTHTQTKRLKQSREIVDECIRSSEYV